MISEVRTVKKIVTGVNDMDGAGVKLVRVLGHNEVKEFDPFLMMDAFDSVNPEDYIKGFPWHPHRGIETVTYLLEGNIEHSDSLGNKGSILDGQCQWMTAGSGIIHQEMPQPSKRMLGVQLWLNLPSQEKMTSPKYRAISKEDIPVMDEEGARVHVVAGVYNGKGGAVEGEYVRTLFLDVKVKPGAEWTLTTEKEDTLFAYILEGEGIFGLPEDDLIKEKHAVLFNEGNTFRVKASDTGIRFLLLSGKPLHETIAWRGPIVMNTGEELELAFKELEDGTFVK